MTVYEYIKNHVNVNLSPSLVQGVGVFALRDIKEGESLFVKWDGESGHYFLNQDEFFQLDQTVQYHLYDMFSFEEHDGKWVMRIALENDCHWIFKTPLHWVNSCLWNEEPNIDRDLLIAKKTIYSGNELFTKYGKYEKIRRLRTI